MANLKTGAKNSLCALKFVAVLNEGLARMGS